MKMVNTLHGLSVCFQESEINVWCIENKLLFTSCIHDIWRQCVGSEGDWILSDADKTLNIAKKVECIIDPFSIDFNNKKIINTLYKDIAALIQEQYVTESISLNSQIVSLIDKAALMQPYELNFEMELDLSGLLKLYNVKFEVNDISLIDKLISYIKIMHQVCWTEIFVFINLKSYLSDDELMHLYEVAFYEKIFLWLIESKYESKNNFEKIKLIDKDLCIIEI